MNQQDPSPLIAPAEPPSVLSSPSSFSWRSSSS